MKVDRDQIIKVLESKKLQVPYIHESWPAAKDPSYLASRATMLNLNEFIDGLIIGLKEIDE